MLALHAMACVAGFIAGSSLPLEAERYSGVWRWVHDKAGPLAIAFVIARDQLLARSRRPTCSAVRRSTLAVQGGISPGLLLLGLLPHAMPELIALFLPLAAWIDRQPPGGVARAAGRDVRDASRSPSRCVVAAAFIEVYVSPHLILALRG